VAAASISNGSSSLLEREEFFFTEGNEGNEGFKAVVNAPQSGAGRNLWTRVARDSVLDCGGPPPLLTTDDTDDTDDTDGKGVTRINAN
jgi:hypothetical protein